MPRSTKTVSSRSAPSAVISASAPTLGDVSVSDARNSVDGAVALFTTIVMPVIRLFLCMLLGLTDSSSSSSSSSSSDDAREPSPVATEVARDIATAVARMRAGELDLHPVDSSASGVSRKRPSKSSASASLGVRSDVSDRFSASAQALLNGAGVSKDAAKDAAKEAKVAEREAAKEAKVAERKAAKEAAKAAKVAEREAAKAAKEAAKEAAKAAKEAAKAAKGASKKPRGPVLAPVSVADAADAADASHYEEDSDTDDEDKDDDVNGEDLADLADDDDDEARSLCDRSSAMWGSR